MRYIIIYLTLIPIQSPLMILKFIYGNQIHLYGLKQSQSYQHACEKIRMMFKGLPEQFVLTYRNSEQLELEIDSNEQLDQLLDDLKGNAKMVKLYITDVSGRKVGEEQLQVGENKVAQEKGDKCEVQNLQEESGNYKQLVQESVPFTDLHQQQTCALISEYQRISSSDKKQFQHLDSSDQQENEVQRQVKNYLRDKMQNICFDDDEQRQQLDKNNEMENSDPREMENLGDGKQHQKETLGSHPEEKQGGTVQEERIKVEQQVGEVGEVEKLHFAERKKIFQPYEPKQRSSSQGDNIRLHRAKCDMCQVAPIIGVRYKCVICPNYDLCQRCEQYHSHQHPLLKICFNYQTPISIKVQIPQLHHPSPKLQTQPQIVLQRVDLSQLDEEQRKQRITAMASELADLLDIDFHECFRFIRQNEQYTKESLTQLLISRKDGKRLRGETVKKGKKEQKGSGINGIISNVKGFFGSFISN